MAIIAPDIGIDLGTANTRIYVKKHILIDEPSLVVMDRKGRHAIRAIGDEALSLLGRTAGDVTAVHPLADSIIQEFDMAQYMLQYFVRKAIGASRLVKPRAVITVPCRINPIGRRAVRKAAVYAGARENQLYLIEKPFAAALGCQLDVFNAKGSMIVDVGGGTVEAAVISLGDIVAYKSISIGGVKMDEAIIAFAKREFNMLIGERTAEDAKITLGSALPPAEERWMLIRGRDMITNLSQTAQITSSQVCEALRSPCQAILSAIREVLERTPPELAGDVLQSGIYLTGGGAQLFGLDKYIESALKMPVYLATEPRDSAALGVGYLLEHNEVLQRITRSAATRENEAK